MIMGFQWEKENTPIISNCQHPDCSL